VHGRHRGDLVSGIEVPAGGDPHGPHEHQAERDREAAARDPEPVAARARRSPGDHAEAAGGFGVGRAEHEASARDADGHTGFRRALERERASGRPPGRQRRGGLELGSALLGDGCAADEEDRREDDEDPNDLHGLVFAQGGEYPL
jgi:hypothetical protein